MTLSKHFGHTRSQKEIADIFEVAWVMWVILTILELRTLPEKWQQGYRYSTNRNRCVLHPSTIS